MMRLRVRWTGLEEIREALETMPREIAGAHLRDAVLAGAEVIREQAAANAERHRRTGTLAGDIHAEIDERQTRDDRAVALIGPGKEGWYGRLLEMGHAIVRGTTRATRRVIGRVPPYPWLRPALDERRDEAQAVMAQEFRRRLERVWKRA